MGWLTGWGFRKSHTIIGSVGTGTDYQIRIVVHHDDGTDSGEDVYLNRLCEADFGDVRFTDSSGETELDYWIEEKTDGDNAIFWVKVSDNLDTNQTIYIYYFKQGETTTSNGENTFPLFFDDFEDNDISDYALEFGAETVSSPVKEGSYASHVYHDGGRGKMEMEVVSVPDDFIFQCYVRRGETDAQTWVRLYDTSANTVQIRFTGGDVLWYNNFPNAWQEFDIPTNFSANVWYKLELRIKKGAAGAGEMKAYWEDVLVSTDPITFLTFDKFHFQIFNVGNDQYQDLVIMRKYVETEPTHGDWGEQFAFGHLYLVNVRINGIMLVNVIDFLTSTSIIASKPEFVNTDPEIDRNVWSEKITKTTYTMRVTDSIRWIFEQIFSAYSTVALEDNIHDLANNIWIRKIESVWEGDVNKDCPWRMTIELNTEQLPPWSGSGSTDISVLVTSDVPIIVTHHYGPVSDISIIVIHHYGPTDGVPIISTLHEGGEWKVDIPIVGTLHCEGEYKVDVQIVGVLHGVGGPYTVVAGT